MKINVLGAQHKFGTFQDPKTNKNIVFDNIMLHAVHRNLEVSGDAVKIIKVKSEYMGEILAQVGGKVPDLVGRVLDVELGAYDKVLSIELVG